MLGEMVEMPWVGKRRVSSRGSSHRTGWRADLIDTPSGESADCEVKKIRKGKKVS